MSDIREPRGPNFFRITYRRRYPLRNRPQPPSTPEIFCEKAIMSDEETEDKIEEKVQVDNDMDKKEKKVDVEDDAKKTETPKPLKVYIRKRKRQVKTN
ncbi:hypothetical protein Lalb_Chr19g0132211 [Lupinus albus]|uniref:Uncharacterized protein n=1 Tax=Lupinus albus TaxID=3870 RepID=A0A6A4NU71_LUPAL|nr:hypothetical protein Lalb_Chr19g0132211 [Lupinus albus]